MRPLSTFSGGQTVTAALTALLCSDPEFILLDEPTNNLDSAAKAQLFTTLEALPCPALIISHDRDLLERVHVIAELHADRQGLAHLRLFEGNYSTYRQALDTEQQAAQRHVTEAKNEARKAVRERAENQISSIATPAEAANLNGQSGNLAWLWAWIKTVQSALPGNFTQPTKAWWRMRVQQLEKPKRTCACRSVSIWNLFRMRSHWGGKYWNYIG